MDKYTTLQLRLEDTGILVITMNRPAKKNAISPQMVVEIIAALTEASTDDNVAFVVLTGAGDYYTSGNDMGDSTGSDNYEEEILRRLQNIKNMVDTYIDFPKLLIAIVNGPAIGIGVTTLGLCDLVFCSTTATFHTPFSTLGLCAEGCSSYLFPRIMGNIKANEVLQVGKKLTAAEAKEYGLVVQVFEPEDIQKVLWPRLRLMTKTLSKESIRANKQLLRRWDRALLHEVNAAECKELESRFVSEDCMNAIQRFLQNKNKHANKL